MRDEFSDDFTMRERREPKRGGALRLALVWLVICVVAAFAAPAFVNHLKGSAPQLVATMPGARAATKPPAARIANTVSIPVDRSGHYLLDAGVNGGSVRFLVDTGATYVVLSGADAEAAGINRNLLTFNQHLVTANGEARGALVTLREIRIGQMTQEEVPAVVMDGDVPVSLLGMSFLRRLERYEIRDGQLVLAW
ncbi:MAG TPA: TIGR02281 family clan AA aspartic protease [Stellaceae bacterium]|nr:TIGR02281 family clan AA aspartic protease [Stellaceae bacterium]